MQVDAAEIVDSLLVCEKKLTVAQNESIEDQTLLTLSCGKLSCYDCLFLL